MACFQKVCHQKRGVSTTLKVERAQHQTTDLLTFSSENLLRLFLFSLPCLFLLSMAVYDWCFFFSLSLVSSLWYSPGKLDSPTHWPHGPPWKTKSLWVAKYICHTHTHTPHTPHTFQSDVKENLLSPWFQLMGVHTTTHAHSFSHFSCQLSSCWSICWGANILYALNFAESALGSVRFQQR